MILPDECRTMADVRAGVDALDAQILALMGTRFQYMAAAARIKPRREQVRDEDRKAAVIANVRAAAAQAGVPVGLAAELYETLVEASIAYELARFDAAAAERG